MLANGADPNLYDANKTTALLYAAFKGRTEIVDLLLTNGADPNLQGTDGRTALILATHMKRTKTIDLLINNGADLDIQDKEGKTALNWAMLDGYDAIVYMLLHAHAEHFNRYSDVPRAVVGDKVVDAMMTKQE